MTDLDREITIPASLSPLRSRIVRAALAEVGAVEEGGNNRGPAVETYQRAACVRPGGAWCGAFCRWVYERADSPLAPHVLGGVARTWRGWPLPYVAATGTIYADLGRVQPGDLAVFARATSRTRDLDAQRIRGGAVLPAHVGIVVEVGPAGYTTVEGNVRVQPRGVRPGDGVAVRDHGWAEIGTVGWLPAEKKAWTAAEWNARHAQGIRVRYYPVSGDSEYRDTRTRSQAWTLCHGTPVVLIDGQSGGVALSNLAIAQGPSNCASPQQPR